MAYITCAYIGSSFMPLVATRGSEPGGRSCGTGSSDSSCQAALGGYMLEDFLRCQYFAIVKFFRVAISECSSTRFFQFTRTVLLIMCYKVEIVFSKTTWYWGETCPVLVFNTRSTEPA